MKSISVLAYSSYLKQLISLPLSSIFPSVGRKGLGIGEFTLYFNAVNQFSASINILLKGYLSLTKMGLYVDDLIKFMALPHMDSVGGNEDFVKGKKFCQKYLLSD